MKAFLDTNILVYAHDPRHPAKRERCRELIRRSSAAGESVISTQVLQECYQALTAKLRLHPPTARSVVLALPRLHETVQVTPELIGRGMDLHQIHQLSFWDGLIVAAALQGACGLLWSEDLQHDRIIDGLRIASPFRE